MQFSLGSLRTLLRRNGSRGFHSSSSGFRCSLAFSARDDASSNDREVRPDQRSIGWLRASSRAVTCAERAAATSSQPSIQSKAIRQSESRPDRCLECLFYKPFSRSSRILQILSARIILPVYQGGILFVVVSRHDKETSKNSANSFRRQEYQLVDVPNAKTAQRIPSQFASHYRDRVARMRFSKQRNPMLSSGAGVQRLFYWVCEAATMSETSRFTVTDTGVCGRTRSALGSH